MRYLQRLLFASHCVLFLVRLAHIFGCELFKIPVRVRGRNKQNVEIMYEYMIDGQHYTGKRLVEVEPIPELYALVQNFPNPFNPITTLMYDLPSDAFVTLSIYDMLGREITQLVNIAQQAGFKSIQWDAKDSRGKLVSAGVYIYQIQADEFVQTRKMVLLR